MTSFISRNRYLIGFPLFVFLVTGLAVSYLLAVTVPQMQALAAAYSLVLPMPFALLLAVQQVVVGHPWIAGFCAVALGGAACWKHKEIFSSKQEDILMLILGFVVLFAMLSLFVPVFSFVIPV